MERRDPFLTPSELQRFTGRQQPAAQARWLEQAGVPYLRNAAGRVIVMRDSLAHLMHDVEPQQGPQPRLDLLT